MVFIIALMMSFTTSVYAQSKEEEKDEVVVSDFATNENNAKGTVYENVDETGEDFVLEGLDKDGKIKVISRQFVSFKTKSGKTLHLVIDHAKKSDNVMLLTEVSEFDLLNMVEMDDKDKEKLKPKSLLIDDEKKKTEAEPKEDKLKEEEKEPEKKSTSSTIFIVLIAVVIGAAGYYFKVYKPKQENSISEYDSDESEMMDEHFLKDDDVDEIGE